jgi:hypothetical protein
MPKKTPTGKAPKITPKHARAAGWKDPLHPQQPLISGKWLLSALGIVLAAATLSAYIAFCLLFYQGSWQLIFHPSRTVSATPASIGLAYDDIHFDYTETGKPQLAGWWVPAGPDARYPKNTLLLLHDGHGALSDTLNEIQTLHALGINVFAFDYRGFGQSADAHPSELSMNQDADAAWIYLTGTRHLQPSSIILYGIGLGAPVAASSAARHPEVPALILENVSPNALTLLSADARTKMLPVRLLTSDRFDPTATLKTMSTPKLFLERGSSPQTEALFHSASDQKQLFQFAAEDTAKYFDALQRFLDTATSQ